jgi:hypothetical protein
MAEALRQALIAQAFGGELMQPQKSQA